MKTRQRRNTPIGKLIVPAISLAFLAYFTIQAQTGRYGLESKHELATLLDRRETELAKLIDERTRLEQRVQLLHDGTLERDMIDERARRALNVGTEDEIVILR